MWIIKRPEGTQYTRKNLDGLMPAYGYCKEDLEGMGWLFTDTTPTPTPEPKVKAKAKPKAGDK
tara:strand:+ start:72 stop:260 length:189 start_codon:yes stop_codon:yes gene_type:complete